MESLENYDIVPTDLRPSCIETLKTVFEDYPDGFVFKDENLSYLFANKAFYKLFGINGQEDIMGRQKLPFMSKKNQDLICDAGKNVAQTLKPLNYIMNEKNSKEQDFVFNITTSPVIYDKKFYGIVSIIKDITAEESIKENFVLKHFQLKTLIENLPMLIYIQDKDGKYMIGTEYSKRFLYSGYDAFCKLQLDAKSNYEALEYNNRLVIQNNCPLSQECKIADSKSHPHWYKVCKVPITDYKGQLTGVLTIANNIDLEKSLEAQKETFVATLGHDLKNPTIAQIRSVELLLKGDFGTLTDEQKEILEMVLESCKYMNGMLASLLATYRNNSGIVKLKFEEFYFNELLDECVSEMEYVAKDKGIKIFTTKSQHEKNQIIADRVQLKRVIMNLLSNGIKYAFKNTMVELRIYYKDDEMFFELENDSPYIPENEQEAIFGQYVSYASTLNELGSGLGLYASQKIINSHDGEMFVKSFKDNKNIFGFRIPLKPKTNASVKDISF